MKPQLEKWIYMALGVVFTLIFLSVADSNRERRFVLYHIRNELTKEMSRNEVEEILERHQTSFIHRYETKNVIILRVDVGIARSYLLTIGFSDGKLNGAGFATEDGPYHPKDAPPNLE